MMTPASRQLPILSEYCMYVYVAHTGTGVCTTIIVAVGRVDTYVRAARPYVWLQHTASHIQLPAIPSKRSQNPVVEAIT